MADPHNHFGKAFRVIVARDLAERCGRAIHAELDYQGQIKLLRDRVLAQSGLPPGFRFVPGTTVLNAPIGRRDEPVPSVQDMVDRLLRRTIERSPKDYDPEFLSPVSGLSEPYPPREGLALLEFRRQFGGGL
jgi:hypothetical protein